MSDTTVLATFAAGCFWGIEAAFRKVPGVLSAQAGYAGGDFVNPSYDDVITGKTGHTEAVQLTYNPSLVNYEDLLRIFFFIHDPTQIDRQGNDIGPQYRSVIFYYTDAQRKAAQTALADEERERGQKLATELVAAGTFYPAEEYHQRYLEKNPRGYCHVNLHQVEKFVAEHAIGRRGDE